MSSVAAVEPALSAGDEKSREKRRVERRRKWFWRVTGYVLFLTIWQLTSTFLVEGFILPPPLRVVERIYEILASGLFFDHFTATLQKIAIGFTIAFFLGAFIGILMGVSPWWNAFFSDWVLLMLTTPGLIFALVSAMIFGLSATGPIVAVAITSYSFVAVNVVEGVRAAPRDLIDMARAYEVPRADLYRHVMIPYLAPYLFTAVRYGFSVAWKIATLTEIVGGTEGIGFMMRREFQVFSMSGFLAWALLFFAFALFLERVILQRQIDRFFRWRPEVSA